MPNTLNVKWNSPVPTAASVGFTGITNNAFAPTGMRVGKALGAGTALKALNVAGAPT